MQSEKIVLQARNLSLRFGGVIAVDQVNFTLRHRELRCLIGPNGAGKTSFFRCLTGQYLPTQGNIWLKGQRITGWSTHKIASLGVGIKTQIPSLFESLSVFENLWLAEVRARSVSEKDEAVEQMAEKLKLTPYLATTVGNLAHGVRQRIEIAVVLMQKPWLLLLDEPAGGLTQDEVHLLIELIREINQQCTLIVVEHDMSFVRQIAQNITVFHQGKILIEGDVNTVMQNPQVRDVYLGNRT
ncbi:MAG: ATP-binding cassette domain-containing protein [Gammaproteobacteria bacterium]|nr:ATP-binding cassette domain-containing protein [Gammaproteobacteria bacterium]